MSNIPINKKVFDKDKFSKVIDTNFKQFNQKSVEEVSFTLDDFFTLYEQLFYQIPKEGDINSHRFIIEKEAEYLGILINEEDIQALVDEITLLRQQVLDSQQIIKDLTVKQ